MCYHQGVKEVTAMTSPKERTDQENLAHNLLWLRKKYSYSQKTMAQLLGIGVGSLRKPEQVVSEVFLICSFFW